MELEKLGSVEMLLNLAGMLELKGTGALERNILQGNAIHGGEYVAGNLRYKFLDVRLDFTLSQKGPFL